MTSTTAPEAAPATKARKSGPAVKIDLGGEPSVQLLPSDVRDRAIIRSRMRTGVLFILLGAVVVAGMLAYAMFRDQQAQQALQQANNRTAEILSEQTKYTEAVMIDRLVTQVKELQTAATETEVAWGELIPTLTGMLPPEAYIQDLALIGAVPWNPPVVEDEDPERAKSVVASVAIQLSTVTVQDATAYTRSLGQLQGFEFARISKVAVGDDGRVASSIVVLLDREATSGRFAPSADATEEGDG